jgi:Fe-S-cluster-containing dehydrogenase component
MTITELAAVVIPTSPLIARVCVRCNRHWTEGAADPCLVEGCSGGAVDVQELAGSRIAEIEEQLRAVQALEVQATQALEVQAVRTTALEIALRALISRLRRVGGYASPEDQQALWDAEWVLRAWK